MPDDLDLSQRVVRDSAAEVPPGYTPPDLFTGALQHTDPKLSWDETDTRRKKVRGCAGVLGPKGDCDGHDSLGIALLLITHC